VFCRVALRQLRKSAGVVIGPRGRWFAAPGGARVSLTRRAALSLIVDALMDAHPSHVTTQTLVERAWPGEKLVASSGKHRLHTAITTLRGFGLPVERHEDGYRLGPGVTRARVS
jgi:hypothetical protein